jgi:phosphopantetheinyl transferase (holo-ACP synthase)
MRVSFAAGRTFALKECFAQRLCCRMQRLLQRSAILYPRHSLSGRGMAITPAWLPFLNFLESESVRFS